MKLFFKQENGQALTEFALVLPILFLMVFGFIQISIVISEKQKLNFVAQYSVETGALTNKDEKIIGAINEYYDLKKENIELDIMSTNGDLKNLEIGESRQFGNIVTVSLKKDYHLPFTFNTSSGPISSFSIEAAATSRIVCNNSNYPYTCDYE